MSQEKIEHRLYEAIGFFVTANKLWLRPNYITNNLGTTLFNDNLMKDWVKIAIEKIHPAVHMVYDYAGRKNFLGDLGLGELGEAVLGLVRAMDRCYKFPTYQEIDWERAAEVEVVRVVAEHGVNIFNAYLRRGIEYRDIIYCATHDLFVDRDDLNKEDCEWAEPKAGSRCENCSFKKRRKRIKWLKITLPEPLTS